jgi:hypothetical protein
VSYTNSLLTIAQLAVGLIGVSAIVSVFLSRGELHPFDRWRFAAIVLIGMLVVFGAFVPIWTGYLLVESDRIWRAASMISIVVGLLFAVPAIRYAAREFGRPTRGTYLGAVGICGLGNLGLLAINALAWPLPPNQLIYELALFTGLVQLAIYFVDLTIFRPA